MPSIGFIDESARDSAYVIGAVILDERSLGEARDYMRRIADGMRRRRIHLSELPPKLRERAATEVLVGPWHAIALVAPVLDRAHERSRRRLLSQLPWRLDGLDRNVSRLVLESRGRALDQSDLLLRIRLLTTTPMYPPIEFARPLAEPLLWAADVVAGSVSHAVTTGYESPFDYVMLDGRL